MTANRPVGETRGAHQEGAPANARSPPQSAAAVRLQGLWAGGITRIGTAQQPTGIVKTTRERVQVSVDGIVGDVQADRRFHGGADKALHHFAAESYARLAAAFPALDPPPAPGGLGENLSTSGWTEDDIAIGEVYGAGDVVLQVTQPRSPCWKIDERLRTTGASRWIADQEVTGWYCRVLAGGELRLGDELKRAARSPNAVPVREFWRIVQQRRPTVADLERLAGLPGLGAEWRTRLLQRIDWLVRNPGQNIK